MRRREPSEFEKKYGLQIIIGLYVFLILGVFIGRIAFLSTKTNYTEITGVITDIYRKRSKALSGRHRRRRRIHTPRSYLTVQYSFNGKQETIDGLPGNFWESTGNTIRFYLTEDGRAVREPVFSSFYLYMFLAICILVVKKIWDNGKIPSIPINEKSEPVGVVVDDYDWIPTSPDNDSAGTFSTDTKSETAPNPQPENSAFPFSENEKLSPEKSAFDNPTSLRLVSNKPEFELYTEEE